MNATENQLHNDAIYIEAYHAWVGSLPSERQAELESLNLAEPDARRTTGKYDDEGALLLASTPAMEAVEKDGSVHEDQNAATRREVADSLASFCARVRAHPNPLLAFDSLCFASGLMDMEGLSQTALARRHGVTRSAFSSQVIDWIDLFDLPQPRGCRSALARKAHSQARIAYLERKRSQPTAPPVVKPGRRRNRYPARSEDPTVVYVRGLDSFRLWFQRRTRSRPLNQWTPEARSFLCKELAWFVKLHERLAK